jgi:hypothetical protein
MALFLLIHGLLLAAVTGFVLLVVEGVRFLELKNGVLEIKVEFVAV